MFSRIIGNITYPFTSRLDVLDVKVDAIFNTVGDPADRILDAPWDVAIGLVRTN